MSSYVRKLCSNYFKEDKVYKCLGADVLNEGFWKEPEEECILIESKRRCPFFERFILKAKHCEDDVKQAYKDYIGKDS